MCVCTSDHVLDVVSMPGAVDVCIVSLCSLILDMGSGNCDPSLSLLRGIVDVAVRFERCTPCSCQYCTEGGGVKLDG